MKFYVFEGGEAFGVACREICARLGSVPVGVPSDADFALAPLLRRKLAPWEYQSPRLGTLVFHPSALPYRRGPDAIRRAVTAGERVSAATWFWCADGWDTGPICEQEVVVLCPGESAGRAYHSRFIPAGLTALERAVRGILAGRPRSVPQDEALASYEPAIELRKRT